MGYDHSRFVRRPLNEGRNSDIRWRGCLRRLSMGLCILAFFSLALRVEAPAGETAVKTGRISGRVIDGVTQSPLVGATVMVVGTQHGTATDVRGDFAVADLPVGSYRLSISSVAYETLVKTDIIVRSRRNTFVEAALQARTVEVGGFQVTSDYFAEDPARPTSNTGFSGEEVRRAPGSAGDVSRIVSVLPSIAKVNDQLNSLIVRGGTPSENGFYLDNIEIPNINHFPLPGTSGGPISLVNVDFIQEVSFSAGGFGARYGDRLSAIMDLKFREGNREEFDGQLDLNFAGFGVVGEGPLNRGRGSWMLSVRRSYLDLLVDAIGMGVAPRYSDYQGKAVYDLSPSHQLSLLAVVGDDFVEFDSTQSVEDGSNFFGIYEGFEAAAGVNWRYLWGKKGYSNTSISVLATELSAAFDETDSGDWLTNEATSEKALQLRNANVLTLGRSAHLEFGVEAKGLYYDYDIHVVENTDALGNFQPALNVVDRLRSWRGGLFASLTASPTTALATTVGLRYDYLEYNRHGHLSPRLSLAYQLGPRTTLNVATGLYRQHLPLALLAQHERNRSLRDPIAYQYILGLNHLLTDHTKLTVEAYYKRYDYFPVDPGQPQLFVFDELIYRGFYGYYPNLQDVGSARSYGVEVTVQKKLVEGTYGMVSGGLSRSEYRGLDGVWRDRVYDNRFVASVEGGYKPNNKWEFSVRWIFAGGPPYTPLDMEASRRLDRSVLDALRVNDERMPAYHSLNLRFDRRYNFSGSSLIVFFSVWNVYNRKNVAQYYWNEVEQDQDVLYQWSLLPVGGCEFEF